RSTAFMEFAGVENHDDFHTNEDGYIHTQDQRVAYIIYDVASEDLNELENQLLLVASQCIEKDKSKLSTGPKHLGSNILGWAHASVDRCAVLLDLWTCETALLEKKCQLLGAVTWVQRTPCSGFCNKGAEMLLSDSSPCSYCARGWKHFCKVLGRVTHYWIIGKDNWEGQGHLQSKTGEHVVSLLACQGMEQMQIRKNQVQPGGAWATGKSKMQIFSVVLAVPAFWGWCKKLFMSVIRTVIIASLLCHLYVNDFCVSFFSLSLQLFAEVLLEDPVLVQEIALSLLEVGADEEKKTDSEKQLFILDSFSTMLELATLRHRLIEVATESTRLARFYKAFAIEAGFGEFRLYLRLTHFEYASHGEKADHLPPIFITSLLEDDSCVDRYILSSLPLSIQEIDSHIGKLSFHTRHGVMQLLCPSGIRNMQLILACQAAVQQASFCYLVQPPHAPDIKVS
ncbi:hypothetical protein FQV19_0001839, partial [Eudyptula minor]